MAEECPFAVFTIVERGICFLQVTPKRCLGKISVLPVPMDTNYSGLYRHTQTPFVGTALQSCAIFPLRLPAGKCDVYWFPKAALFVNTNWVLAREKFSFRLPVGLSWECFVTGASGWGWSERWPRDSSALEGMSRSRGHRKHRGYWFQTCTLLPKRLRGCECPAMPLAWAIPQEPGRAVGSPC